MRTLILCTLLLATCKLSLSTEQPSEAQVDQDAFQKLLKQVDPPALHAALHDFSPKRFAHGMFPEDRTALEAIHKEEPRVATGILKMAKLAKRQDNSTTTPSPAPNPQTSSTPVPESPSPSPSPSSPGPESSSAPASSTTAAPSSSNSFGEVVSSTDAEGHVVVSTIGGGATTLTPSSSRQSSRTSTLLQTNTEANGEQSTITAVTVVGGDEGSSPTGTQTEGANGASSGQPGLQTGEAAMTRGCGKEFAVVFGAAVGVAFML